MEIFEQADFFFILFFFTTDIWLFFYISYQINRFSFFFVTFIYQICNETNSLSVLFLPPNWVRFVFMLKKANIPIVEKGKISYFGLARNLIRHLISPNQDDVPYSSRASYTGSSKLGKLPNTFSLAGQRRPVQTSHWRL